MKKLSLKKINTVFIFLFLTMGIFNVHAADGQIAAEEYVPELMNDGSVIFKKKSGTATEEAAAPALKLRSATITCCKAINVGGSIINVCKQLAGTSCPPGTTPK